MSYQERIADIRQQGGINFHFPVLKKGGIKPGLWNHVCVSYNSPKRQLVYIHNGEIQLNYTNVPLAFEVPDGIPKSYFSPVFRTPGNLVKFSFEDDCDCSKLKNCRLPYYADCDFKNRGSMQMLYRDHFAGYVTDHNMWSRALSIPEMLDLTTCKSFQKGDLLPWNPDDWTPVQLDDNGDPIDVHSNVEVDSEAFCSKSSPNGKTYTLFTDNMYNHDNGLLLCKQFGGTMAHTRTKEESDIVHNYIQDTREKSANWKEALKSKRIWYRYRDEEEDGVWKDPETGFIASFMNCRDDPNDCYGVINWNLNHEPEGGAAENCAGGIERAGRLSYDITCDQESCIICEEISRELNLRGLCPLSKIGKKYLMGQEPLDNRRYFTGYTGWKLSFEDDVWSLKHMTTVDTFAEYTDSKHYPMGRKTWKVTNDVCSGIITLMRKCTQLCDGQDLEKRW